MCETNYIFAVIHTYVRTSANWYTYVYIYMWCTHCIAHLSLLSTVKQPFEAWVTKTVSDVNGLLRQASDSKKVVTAKEKLEAIQKAAMTKEKDVSVLSDLSLKFVNSREVSGGSASIANMCSFLTQNSRFG